jgi:NAD(P)H-hydrate repair Nnr-like enzyme with NAD(P)H-hydrate dehydratase domain
MAFYLRRLHEVDQDQSIICGEALVTGSGVATSGSAAFAGSDTVDIATLRTQVQAIETALNEVVTLLGG